MPRAFAAGQLTRPSVTRSLGRRADLVLMDEPTEGVQPENIERTAALIATRCAAGTALVIVEQNLAFLETVADDVLVLDHGDAVLAGSFAEFGRERLERHLLV